jgi:hypothetical protein
MFVQLAREDFELIGKLRKMTNDRVDRVIVKISLDFIIIYIYIFLFNGHSIYIYVTHNCQHI